MQKNAANNKSSFGKKSELRPDSKTLLEYIDELIANIPTNDSKCTVM